MSLGNTTTNAIKTFLEGCAESWGIPLSKAVPSTFEMVSGSSDKAKPNNAQNPSKNKALLDFEFVARLTFRIDSDEVFAENRYLTSTGEQAHV